MTDVSYIIKNDLCLGCGLCQAINQKNCKMELSKRGFYRPLFNSPLSKEQKAKISKLCPGIRVHNINGKSNFIWGNVVQVSNAWSTNPSIRQTSSSGGVTSSLAIYLLESHKVDGVLHIGVQDDSYLYNKLYISRNREEVLKRNASRYAPAAIFNHILDILSLNTTEIYAFIGKPCDIAGIQNLLQEYPEYKYKIKYYLAIFCAGMPSYNASQKAISTFMKKCPPISLRYRGDGWPGYFTVGYSDGTTCRMTYNESWGKILGRDLGFRCKICPDGIGLLADIALGDSWNTSNGYPDFTEADGKNFCFIRNQKGLELFREAEREGYIITSTLDIKNVKYMQRYQYERRHYVGWRIATIQLLSGGILNFDGLGFYITALKVNYYKAFKDLLGTILRYRAIIRSNGE